MIRFGDVSHARMMAIEQHVGAYDLLRDGIVDEIVEEPVDLDVDPADFCRRIGEAVERQLDELFRLDPRRRGAQRVAKYRELGTKPVDD